MIDVNSTDVARSDVLLKTLKRIKIELEGEEILAVGQSWHWLILHNEKIKSALLPKPIETPIDPPVEMTYTRKKAKNK